MFQERNGRDVLVDKTMLLKHVEKQKNIATKRTETKAWNRINLSTSLIFV
jgi:hypothetical protein